MSCHFIDCIGVFFGIFTVKMKKLDLAVRKKLVLSFYIYIFLFAAYHIDNLFRSFYLLKSKHINSRISISDLKSNGNGSKTVYIVHIENGVRYAVYVLTIYRTCRHFAHDSHFVSYN